MSQLQPYTGGGAVSSPLSRHGRAIGRIVGGAELSIVRVAAAAHVQQARLDALDQVTSRAMQGVALVALAPADAADKLRQTGFNHGVDCWAINRVVNETRTSDGTPRFTTVRGAFQEGAPLFSAGSGRDKESAIRTLDHVQICVSDESAIRHLVQVTRPIVLD